MSPFPPKYERVSRERERIARQDRLKGAQSTLLLMLAVVIAVRVFSMTAGRWLQPAAGNPAGYSLILLGQELFFYGLPAGLYYFAFPRRRGLWMSQMGRPGRGLFLGCLGLGALHQWTMQLVTLIWAQGLLALHVPLKANAVPLPRNGAEALLLFLAVAAAPALCEESLFRGALYPGLCREFSKRQGLILASCIFALMHGSLYGLPAHLAVGFMLTALCARRESLPLCMAYHLSYNGASLLSALWDPENSLPAFLGSYPELLAALAALMVMLSVFAAARLVCPLPGKGESRPSRPAWALAALVLALLIPGYILEFFPAL